MIANIEIMFDKLFEKSPYLACVCLGTALFGFIGLPLMWLIVGFVSGEWNPPWWFVLGFFGIGFVIGNLYYLMSERL